MTPEILEIQRRFTAFENLLREQMRGSVSIRQVCSYCALPVGVLDGECTGWHPAFKCDCGYEEHSERATTYDYCPHCRKVNRAKIDRDPILNAEEISNT